MKHALISILLLLVLCSAAPRNDIALDVTDCAIIKGGKTYPLAAKVKVVSSGGDIKVKVVSSFPDLKIQITENSPSCCQWRFVESFPDFTVEYVNDFQDVKVQYVKSFPGIAN